VFFIICHNNDNSGSKLHVIFINFQQPVVENLLNSWATSLQTSLEGIVTMVTEYTNQQQERIEWLQKNLDEQNDIDQVYFLKIILDFTNTLTYLTSFNHTYKFWTLF
jgi:hypothetical protein